MFTPEFIREINAAYCQLEQKLTQLLHSLSLLPFLSFPLESGWFNGHYGRRENGEWQRDAYPIPVITVKGLCDIEIPFGKISVSTKKKRADALEYSYEKTAPFPFEAYGVKDYLADYFHEGQTMKDLKNNIQLSDEAEIGFSFFFPFETDAEQLSDFVKLLWQEGFYY